MPEGVIRHSLGRNYPICPINCAEPVFVRTFMFGPDDGCDRQPTLTQQNHASGL